VSWWFSLIFVIALLGILITFLVNAMSSSDTLRLRVVDTAGAPISGAIVTIGTNQYQTDDEGEVTLASLSQATEFTAEGDGYDRVSGTVDPDGCSRCEITLRTAQSTDAPDDTAVTPPPTETSAGNAVTTDETPIATDAVTAASPTSVSTTAPSANAAPTQSAGVGEIAGTITDASGAPIQGARIVSGDTWEITGADGVYALDRTEVDASKPLTIFASGYADQEVAIPAEGQALDVSLETLMVKGLYLNPNITTTEADYDRLIDLVDTTELNAIVIDVKEDIVYYDTQVPLFQDSGSVNAILDLPALLAEFKAHDIYVIARLVVFKDGLVAEANPDMAVLHETTGEVWRDMNGAAWVNPTNKDLWKANADMAVELANMGFDEIQYDYVRFPTDGDLSTMDFGVEYNQANREAAINDFLELSHDMLIPTGAKLSADIFGYTMLVADDLGIGQNIATLTEHVDFISPMVYPSHYDDGVLGLNPPNDYPYELIDQSMQIALPKIDDQALKIRPWLQDFDFWGMTPYDASMVRAQIDAVEDNGGSGWLLWDPENQFTKDALLTEDGQPVPSSDDTGTAEAAAILPDRRITIRARLPLTR